MDREEPHGNGSAPVIPVVLYQGPGRWTGPKRLSEIVDLSEDAVVGPVLRRHLPDFEIAFEELGATSVEVLVALPAPPEAVLALVFLRAAREGGVLAALDRRTGKLIEELKAQPYRELVLVQLAVYIASVSEGPEERVLELIAFWFGPEVRNVAKTTLETVREEGFKQGLERGSKALLERLLRAKFGAIPATIQARLDAAQGSDLERWGERILTASTLDEVFA